jgi:hypothetical protein
MPGWMGGLRQYVYLLLARAGRPDLTDKTGANYLIGHYFSFRRMAFSVPNFRAAADPPGTTSEVDF